jgi:hypothetical protein
MRLRVALFTLGMAACGYAQTYVADIPFRFHIGDQSYASGRYYFSQRVSTAAPEVAWAIRSSETDKTMTFQTVSGSSPAQALASRLVFNKYGTTYFLSEVWAEGRPGRQLPASPSERNLAKNTRGIEVVTVSVDR